MKKVIAIQNCGPSGTTLIQSLLDGHPRILSLPALHAQELLIFWETVSNLPKSEIQTRLFTYFKHFFSSDELNNGLGLKELGTNRDEAAVIDREVFSRFLNEAWQDKDQITRKEFLDAIYIAYNQTLGRDVTKAEYILYPIHCLPIKYANALVEDYEIVRFLHSVREPVQSIGSLAKHIDKNPGWDPLYILTCVSAQLLCDYAIHVGHRDAHGMRSYFPNSKDGSVESKAIRLEDLHKEPKAILTKICDWLNIEWSDCLLLSTFNGKLWHNRPESIRQSGIGNKTLSQTHADIVSNFDRYRFNLLSKHFREMYGYSVREPNLNRLSNLIATAILFIPFKLEFKRDRIARQYHFSRSKLSNKLHSNLLVNILTPLYLGLTLMKNYVSCRMNWLLPALKRIKQNKPFDYVELL